MNNSLPISIFFHRFVEYSPNTKSFECVLEADSFKYLLLSRLPRRFLPDLVSTGLITYRRVD